MVPGGSVSPMMGCPSGDIRALSFPLSPRSEVSVVSMASVRYAVEGALGSVSDVAMLAVAGVTPPAGEPGSEFALALAIDQDHPLANAMSTITENASKRRSVLPGDGRAPLTRE